MNEPDFAPVTISARETTRGLRLSIIASSICMFFAAVSSGIPYTMLLERLGASGKVQGVAATVAQLSLVAMLLSAIFAERLGSRRTFWRVFAVISRSLWFIPPFLIYFMKPQPATAAIIIAIACVSGLMGNMGGAVWQSWMADLVPEDSRGAFWGRRQMWTMTTLLISMGLSGWLLDVFDAGNPEASMFGFALVFFLAAISGITEIIIHWSVPEPVAKALVSTRSLRKRLLLPIRHPSFRRLALAMGFWTFSCTVVGPFGSLYLKRVVHATYTEMSMIAIAGAVSNIVAGFGAGYIIDRVGAKAVASVMLLLCPLFGVFWFLITDTPVSFILPLLNVTIVTKQAIVVLITSSFLGAGLYSIIALCHLSLVAAIAPKRGRTVAMAVQWTLIGLIGAIGPLIGGVIMDACGDGFNFFLRGTTRLNFIHLLCLCHAAIAWGIALPLLRSVRVRHEIVGLRRAIGLLLPANPLRFASGIYHGRTINLPATPEKRLRAVEAVGETGSEIAVQDLCAKLNDPSLDVREAAVASLGQIASREACASLLQTITNPESDLIVPALRALRGALRVRPDATSMTARLAEEERNWAHGIVTTVTPLLAHPNLEVVREAARLLGHIPHPMALAGLLDLLHTTRYDPIALAAASALGRQGDVTAVYEIIPRMRSAQTAAVEKAFAVTASDLMGQPGGFYKMLTQEEQTHNSALADMVKRLTANSFRLAADKHSRFFSEMGDALADIERHYEAHNLTDCALITLRITRLFAHHRYDIPQSLAVFEFLPELERRDPRFAAGAWFIALLTGAFDRTNTTPTMRPVRSLVEIQLAVYILSSWANDLFKRIHSPYTKRASTPCHSRWLAARA